ncbi:MAG: NAD(P)H-quinone oxidoreductase subunit 5 [Cyclobacteriaceae bacterium]|jgi:NAD(P)H-quinone oxidoreductase subunit 5
MQNIITLIPVLAPLLLFSYALVAILNADSRIIKLKNTTQYLGAFGILVAIISAGLVTQYDTFQSATIGWNELGFSIRLDALSMTMFTMISLLGFIILRFSTNYLDGDARQAIFLARLATTIASVELLVLSGNLGQLFVFWVITSVCMHYLLVFYRNRPQAIAAARKKFIVARLGDLSLFLAIVLVYVSIGSGDLAKIFEEVQNAGFLSVPLTWATIFFVLAAVLKSAQFPTHGWLIEVVETPTPVSALLHAGLLNAGPFLIVRMGFLMSASTTASLMLIIIGGFTAMFASVVYLTQPTVKVSLGYSSVAHMGFSLLVCGFGVYSAAILHLVAHSFYKAHSFLSSGSTIDSVRAKRISVPKRRGSYLLIALSIAFSLAVYAIFCYLWGIQPQQDFGLMAIGAIIVMGLSQILTQTLDSKGTVKAMLQSAFLVIAVAGLFFILEKAAHWLLQSQIPQTNVPSMAIQMTSGVIVFCFVVIVLIQLAAPNLNNGKVGYMLGVHLRNGLYANVIFDRLVGSLKSSKFRWVNLTIVEGEDFKRQKASSLIIEKK